MEPTDSFHNFVNAPKKSLLTIIDVHQYMTLFYFILTWLKWTLLHSDLTHFWYKTLSVIYCLNPPLASVTWIFDKVQQHTDKGINTALSATHSGNEWISSTFSIGTSLQPQCAKQFWITFCTVDSTCHYTWPARCSTFQFCCRNVSVDSMSKEMHKANSLYVFDTHDTLVKWCIRAYIQITTQSYGQRIKTSSLFWQPIFL